MIRSELDVLLDKVEDPALRADLRTQFERLAARRSYGLVFERHIPERVRLPQHPVRVGSYVVRRDLDASPTWEVLAIRDGVATLRHVFDAEGTRTAPSNETDDEQMDIASLVVITGFGDPVLPGLRFLGSVERGGDKPHHAVIKGENHHVLEALRFTHAGKVDCIYIDPPYNTGARDWKYDNDYVDANDAYRHSKWLAFMERRLKLAKELLNPEDSVLIVTIDENEQERTGLLLEQVYTSAEIQLVSIVINPSGVSSGGGLSRVEEYAYFCFIGSARPAALSTDLLDDRPAGDAKARSTSVRWEWLLRGGGSWYRESRPNLCYPIVLNEDGDRIVDVGSPWSGGDESTRPREAGGLPLAWPVRNDGRLGIWRVESRRDGAGPQGLRLRI